MKFSRLALVVASGFMVACTLGLSSGDAMAKMKCPKGFKKAGQEVDALAECSIDSTGQQNDLMGTITTIINVVVGVLGVAAVAVIVLGGVTFVTSQGDAAKVTKAKNTIIYGIVGLFVAILAFAIVNFVLGAVFTPAATETKKS